MSYILSYTNVWCLTRLAWMVNVGKRKIGNLWLLKLKGPMRQVKIDVLLIDANFMKRKVWAILKFVYISFVEMYAM